MPQNINTRLKRLDSLKRLGVKKGARHIAIPPPKPRPTEAPANTNAVPLHFLNYQDDLQHAVPIEAVVPGQVIQNEHGQYFSVEARYPLSAPYGSQKPGNLLDVSMQTVALITGDDAWLNLNWQDVLFIDTETTGLEIAAGTVAFLIGVGFVQGDDFVVRQVFMRDFNEESALLSDLHTLCQRFRAVATFNGKTFDIPLLENRFVLARLLPTLFDGPHLDLLHPARRLWRRRLDNCKLATLETEILGLQRSQADIPGYFIPSLYRKYLVDGDARPMAGIFYHNELDIVSMAVLAAALGRRVSGDHTPSRPLDLLSLGLWHIHLGNSAAAERALQKARSQSLPPELQDLTTTKLAYLLKRQNRREEAEILWQELAAAPNNLLALEELAKYYEWYKKDYPSALICIDYALKTLQTQPDNRQQQEKLSAWQHRRERVQGKTMKNEK